MARILSAVEAEALKKCDIAIQNAVKKAAKEIQKDFKAKVFDQAISDYYDDYKPRKYKRCKGLYKAFKVNSQIQNGRYITVDFEWDFNWLPQYKSNSPWHRKNRKGIGNEWISREDPRFNWDTDDEGNPIGDNGIPEKGWIFQNFMEGIHPKFYVSKADDSVVNASEYHVPSWERIKQYKDDYLSKGYARDILIDKLKQEYKKL